MARHSTADTDARFLGREGALRARVENSGDVVFAYDAQLRETLRARGAADRLREALGADGPIAPEVTGLLGQVLAWELEQDDSVHLRVLLGEPLSASELGSCRGLAWMPVQRSVLALPSGVLALDSNSTGRLDAQPPTAGTLPEGAELPVPAGRYAAHLYRVDWKGCEERASEAASEAGLWQVLVLTPLADEAPAPTDAAPALRLPVFTRTAPWSGKWAVKGGRAEALGRLTRHSVRLNLDASALQALGVEPGVQLAVTVGSYATTIACTGGGDAPHGFGALEWDGAERLTAAPPEGPSPLHLGHLSTDDVTGAPYLHAYALRAGAPLRRPSERWTKARVRVLPERFPFPDLEDLGRWREVAPGVVEGVVLLHASRHLALNLDARALEALGATAGDVLEVEVHGVRQRARLVRDADGARRQREAHRDAQEPQVQPLVMAYLDMEHEAQTAYDREQARGVETPVVHWDAERARTIGEQLHALLLGDTPLHGYLGRHWYHPADVLFLEPAAWDMTRYDVVFHVDFPKPTLGAHARVTRVRP
jgi:hypothetical protein